MGSSPGGAVSGVISGVRSKTPNTARVVYVLDALALAGALFVLVWSTVPGSRDSAGGVLVISLTALMLIGLLVLLARLRVSGPPRALAPPLVWVPLSGAALVVGWHLLAGARLGTAETAVALGLVALVVLRQAFTGLDNVRLVRELRESQEKLRAQAYHDSLTGLANRALFDQRLRRAIRGGRPLGLIFCDLDDFKAVNDRLGHNAGDDVLRAVAGRLRALVRPADTVARLGGDEFAILMEDTAQPPDVIGREILGVMGRPFQLLHRGRPARVLIGASVGVAVLDRVDPQASPESLLAGVDQAMYAAKRRGKNQLVTFTGGEVQQNKQNEKRFLPLPDLAAPVAPTGSEAKPTPSEPAQPTTGALPVPPGLPHVVDPQTGPIPRPGPRTPGGLNNPSGLNTPAAEYRAAGGPRPDPPPATAEEEQAREQARIAAAAKRSVERSMAQYQALEKESERREAERNAAERRALEALEIEAEVRAGTRPEAEVIPLSRATDIRAQREAEAARAESETKEVLTGPEAETLEQAEQLATLSSDHIEVLYRPVLGLRSGRLAALAASVQWRHPAHGVLSSDSLMPAAEQVGLRQALEERLFDSICADLAQLRKEPGHHELTAHVPLATLHLADHRLTTVLERTLRKHDLPGNALVLSITEDGPRPDLDSAAEVLGRVRALGVGVGLESFGAGPGDLGFLTRLPIDCLILDSSLTTADSGSRAGAVLAGTVAMTPGLDLTLIADGVSHREQADRLALLGIGLGQGPLYGEPAPLPDLDLFELPENLG